MCSNEIVGYGQFRVTHTIPALHTSFTKIVVTCYHIICTLVEIFRKTPISQLSVAIPGTPAATRSVDAQHQMAATSFIYTGVMPGGVARLRIQPSKTGAASATCCANKPNDPSGLRSESELRRNQPPKPMQRRARRRRVDDPLDWDQMPSVPLVRPDVSPESGEDYWMDVDDATILAKDTPPPADSNKGDKVIDDRLRERLKQEIVSPYQQNWILRVAAVVFVLVVLVAIFGGEEQVPIIHVPDL